MAESKLFKANWKKRKKALGEEKPTETVMFSLHGHTVFIERNQIYKKSTVTDLEASPYPKLSETIIEHPAMAGMFTEVKPKK